MKGIGMEEPDGEGCVRTLLRVWEWRCIGQGIGNKVVLIVSTLYIVGTAYSVGQDFTMQTKQKVAQNKPNKQTERQDFVHSVLLGSAASHYWGFVKVEYCKFALWHRRDGVHVLLGHAFFVKWCIAGYCYQFWTSCATFVSKPALPMH